MKKLFFVLLSISLAFCIADDSFLPNVDESSTQNNLGASNINVLNLVAQYCQSSNYAWQCGPGNCECWTTGNQNGGSNPSVIYCNGNGDFCDGSSCYYPCMDKSPNTRIIAFNYGAPSSKRVVPEAVFTHYIDNYEATVQKGEFKFTERVENSYSWSLSETVSISNTLTVDVGLPEVCDVHDSLTLSLSVTSSHTQTRKTSKEWSALVKYSAAPRSKVRIDYIVSRVEYVIPFSMTVQFGDQVAYWCSNQADGHWFWMPDVGSVLAGQPNCSGNRCTFRGAFVGLQGITDTTTYKTCPLKRAC